MTFAAIDIGSNAVRLLIKRVEDDDRDNKLKKLLLLRVPLRLGFDVFAKGKVSDKKGENLIRLMKAYRQLMKIYSVDECRACATSAMRDAENGKELIKEIEDKTGISIEIIAGEEEAKIVYNNHVEYQDDRSGNFLYVDVGGGSTEVNFLTDGDLRKSMSFNIGTVRILTGKVKDEEWARLNRQLKPIVTDYSDIVIIGSGGNINKLYKMAREKDEATHSFSVGELARLYHILKPLSVKERMKEFDLKSDRADVIIPAAEIFLNIASVTGARRIIVPVIGVADGIIDGLYEKWLEKRDD
jgi:exopolyphosphatase/guanosine-5'-triphosphate,3'-diphosphate pyrophosphatase